jgi:hypothetical protein
MKFFVVLCLFVCAIGAKAQNYSSRPILVVQNSITYETFSLRIGDKLKVQLDSIGVPIRVSIQKIINDTTLELSKVGVVSLSKLYSLRFTPRKASRVTKQVLFITTSALWLTGYAYNLSQPPGQTIISPGGYYLFISALVSPLVFVGIETTGMLVQASTRNKIFYQNRNLNLFIKQK